MYTILEAQDKPAIFPEHFQKSETNLKVAGLNLKKKTLRPDLNKSALIWWLQSNSLVLDCDLLLGLMNEDHTDKVWLQSLHYDDSYLGRRDCWPED